MLQFPKTGMILVFIALVYLFPSAVTYTESTYVLFKLCMSTAVLWGCFSSAGAVKLISRYEMDGAKYKEILEENMLHKTCNWSGGSVRTTLNTQQELQWNALTD
ncbi:hypothetical protein ILYODFUR_033329 [Ilyodon furcidens]|uniref:Uncharacterized protein n=1 Tax=Ilyodon furcidens TaxID=33524 RepID=A0ABV0TRV0_9TELE